MVSISSRLRLKHLSSEWCSEIVRIRELVSIQRLVADSRISSRSDREAFVSLCARSTAGFGFLHSTKLTT